MLRIADRRIRALGAGHGASALLLLAAEPAAAHILVPGISGIASQALHPFAGVETVLVIVTAAIVVGASERLLWLGRAALVALVGGALGALLQAHALAWPGLWRLPLMVAAAFGTLAAIGRETAWSEVAVVTLLAATTIGVGLTPERPGPMGIFEMAVGAATALAIGLAGIAVPRALIRHPVGRIAGRIAGAWTLAIATLGLAASLR